MNYIKLFALCLCLITQNALANEAFMLEVQQKYKSIDSFTADFKQELYHRDSQHMQEKQGSFSFKKDMNIKIDINSPSTELLIANKKEVWNYFPDEEVVYKYKASIVQSSNNILSVITGQTTLYDEFEVEEIGGLDSTRKLKAYAIYPFEPSVEMIEAKVFINTETKLIEAVEVCDFAGNINSIFFNNFVLNPKLNNSLFTFSPPRGVDIEDHTNLGNIMMNTGQ